jgi:hypothetical protein
VSAFTKEELALGERMFDSQPDSPWTAFCELRELFGSMPLERRQELHDVVARRRMAEVEPAPVRATGDNVTTDRRREALHTFIAGYLHGRSSLGNHEAAGREAEAAFNRWWTECGSRQVTP